MNFLALDKEENLNYGHSLQIIASLSKLFSQNNAPFLHYRIMENLFCSCFKAKNLSRSDSAYDAKIGDLGVGLKTFVLQKNSSIGKIAEFNKNSAFLKELKSGEELALALANLRNERMALANEIYGIKRSLYHIVARRENKLIFFETDYEKIEIENIKILKILASRSALTMEKTSIILIILKVYYNANFTFQRTFLALMLRLSKIR